MSLVEIKSMPEPIIAGHARLVEQLRRHVRYDCDSDCLVWIGPRLASGHGLFTWRGQQVRVSRLAYALFRTELEPDHLVWTTCGNASCINPKHLDAGTAADHWAATREKQTKPLTEAQLTAYRESLDFVPSLTDSDLAWLHSLTKLVL